MLFATPSTTTSRSSTLLPLALLVVLLALVNSTAALPTIRSAPAAAPFEALFRRASPQVGPTRPLERLRLRRSLNDVFHGRRNAEVAGMKRALPGPIGEVVVVAPVANPKSKRSSPQVLDRRALGLAPVVANPKVKRSTVVNKRSNVVVSNPKARRSDIPSSSPMNLRRRSAGLPEVVLNPKKRSLAAVSNPKKRSLDALKKRAVVDATISISPSKAAKRSLFEVVKRFLAGSPRELSPDLERRASSDGTFGNSTTRIGTVKIVPNPKSPSFSAGNSSSSSSTVASATSSVAPTSTTSPASSSTSAAPTATATSTGWPTSGGQIAGGYYPDWVEDVMPPEALNYKMFDLINYGASLSLSVPSLPTSLERSTDPLSSLPPSLPPPPSLSRAQPSPSRARTTSSPSPTTRATSSSASSRWRTATTPGSTLPSAAGPTRSTSRAPFRPRRAAPSSSSPSSTSSTSTISTASTSTGASRSRSSRARRKRTLADLARTLPLLPLSRSQGVPGHQWRRRKPGLERRHGQHAQVPAGAAHGVATEAPVDLHDPVGLRRRRRQPAHRRERLRQGPRPHPCHELRRLGRCVPLSLALPLPPRAAS